MHMIDTLLRHKLILIVAAAAVIIGGWWLFSDTSTSSSTDILTTETLGGENNPAGQELVETLLALRTVTLEGTIFSNPLFRGLKDFSISIMPEPVGRPNPFAPLGIDVAPSATTTQGAKIFAPQR